MNVCAKNFIFLRSSPQRTLISCAPGDEKVFGPGRASGHLPGRPQDIPHKSFLFGLLFRSWIKGGSLWGGTERLGVWKCIFSGSEFFQSSEAEIWISEKVVGKSALANRAFSGLIGTNIPPHPQPREETRNWPERALFGPVGAFRAKPLFAKPPFGFPDLWFSCQFRPLKKKKIKHGYPCRASRWKNFFVWCTFWEPKKSFRKVPVRNF